MNNTNCRKPIRHREEDVLMSQFNTQRNPREHDCCTSNHKTQQLYLTCGKGINIDLEDVCEKDLPIVLARIAIDTSGSSKPLIKIDFSTIIEVEDDNEVELVIALKRTCHGDCLILEKYELEFDNVELLPFSFTYCDDELICHKDCCIYTVEIIKIDVDNGDKVDEIETNSTAINAIVQG